MASSLASQSFHQYINGQQKARFSLFISYSLFLILLSSCSFNKQIAKQAKQSIFTDSNFNAAHVGISIYDPSTNKYLYNYQGDKYFVPASNAKLFTCYAAMKHLGDSLLSWKMYENADTIIVEPQGDPTFLHSEFKSQWFFEYLKNSKKKLFIWLELKDNFQPYGRGWAADDYESDYMAERSRLPIYGNVVTIKSIAGKLSFIPKFFSDDYFWIGRSIDSNKLTVKRKMHENKFFLSPSSQQLINKQIPFITENLKGWDLLFDTLGRVHNEGTKDARPKPVFKKVHSQPTDSLLKPMMHRSDNFFAEQSLLMVSNEMLGVMNDSKIIDTLLKTDLKDLPQKPRWVDGSGLSRYNNFTPQSFVALLTKMKTEFDWNRITTILPTGNEGTLSGLYKNYVNRIYAKTGTLSGQVALSGYLITNKNKTLIFSVLVNNHQTSASNIRKAIERFLSSVIEKY